MAEALQGLQIAARDGPWKLVRTLHSFYYVDAFQQAAGDGIQRDRKGRFT